MLPFIAAGMLVFTGCQSGGPTKLELLRKSGIDNMNKGQYEEAIESFKKAYALCDDKMPKTKTDIALYEATCQYNLEDYDALIAVCDQILEVQQSGDAYYFRGVAHMKQGDEDAAADDFDNASELNRSDYQMFLNIYHQYEEISKSAIGDKYIQKALAIPNDSMEDYYQKGYIYYYLGEYEKALDELADPVEAKDEDAMILMGESYLALGDSARARYIFQKYLDGTKKGSAKAYNGLALCDLADHAYEAALANIGSGLAAKPKGKIRRELLYNEIVAYEMKLDFDTAKIKAESFVQNYPEDLDGQREYAFLSSR